MLRPASSYLHKYWLPTVENRDAYSHIGVLQGVGDTLVATFSTEWSDGGLFTLLYHYDLRFTGCDA
jgi:hypothetical protein